MQLIIYNISKWTTHYHFDKNVLFAEAFFSASSNRRAARRVMLRCDDIVQNEGNQLTWKVNIFKMSNLVVHTMHTYDSDNVYFVLMAICIGKRCKSISFHMHFSLSLRTIYITTIYRLRWNEHFPGKKWSEEFGGNQSLFLFYDS